MGTILWPMIAPPRGRPGSKTAQRLPKPGRPLTRRVWPPRALQIGLGVWLVLTVFLWPHSRVQASMAAGAGLLAVLLSLVALRYSPIRLLLGLVGVWLIVGAFVPPTLPLTVANNLLAGVLITALSFFPLGDVPMLPRRTPRES